MKKYLFVAVCLASLSAEAQRIEVVDTDGNGISYATVLSPEAEHIGITDLDGVLADAKGAKAVTITHVAFKPKEVRLDGKNIRVTLEDADFCLDEITVQPKPYVYVQTYYRLYIYSEKEGIYYYRVGLTDNVYDPQKKKVSASTDHIARAKKSYIKSVIGLVGGLLDELSQIQADKVEDRIKKKGKDIGLTITSIAPGKKRISDNWGTLGYITDDKDAGQRRFSYDIHQMLLHYLEVHGKDKLLAKKEKRDAKKQNRADTDYSIYRIDEDGNYGPEDFVMMESLNSYDKVDDGETDHYINGLQVYAIERAYVTKEELKQRKKDNKMKMTLSNIQQFERKHNIPALSPAIQKAIEGLTK